MVNPSSSLPGSVSTQIAAIAVVVSLVIGFLTGVLYSSITSTEQVSVQRRQEAPPGQANPGQMAMNASPEQASKIMALEQQVSANPNDVNSWSQLGHVYFDTNRYAQAINAYNKSLALRPDDPNILTDLGLMYRATGKFAEALAAFEKANGINPRHEQSLLNKGIVHMDLQESAKAIQAWEQLLVINPNAKAGDGSPVKELVARAQKGALLP